jgi:hypothetical protein
MCRYLLFSFIGDLMNVYSRAYRLRLPLLLALLVLAAGGERIYKRNDSQNIDLIPLALDAANPMRHSVGALEFLGGWQLKSKNSDFGGLSALVAMKDGRFLGISDAGTIIGFGLKGDKSADRPFIAALPGALGSANYRDRDSEGLTYDPATGRVWVSYEQRHAIRRFPASLARVDGVVFPPAMRDWPGNQGAEAMVRLRDGRFLVFAEGSQGDDGIYPAILWSGDPVEPGSVQTPFRYRPPEGYRPTDASQLPDGRVLVLNRRIGFPEGFSAKLVLLDPATVVRNRSVGGAVLATLATPLLVDNMEGMAVTDEAGKIIVWLVSDDNFNIFQRTLLMKFALRLPDMKKPETDAPGFDSL